jgi:hypothetical protein
MINEGQIKGIERNLPRAVSDEISAWEILNLRPAGGGWRPVGRKPVEITGITGTALHMHVMDTVHNLISIQDSTLYFKNLETGETKLISNYRFGGATASRIDGELLDINHLGKILIISTTANKYIYTYSDSRQYYIIMQYYPALSAYRENSPEAGINYDVYGSNIADLDLRYKIYKIKRQTEGYTEGWVFLVTVIELADGTYTRASDIQPVYLGSPDMNARVQLNYNDVGHYLADLALDAGLFVDAPLDVADYSGVNPAIAGMAVFGTVPVSMFDDIASKSLEHYQQDPYLQRPAKYLSDVFNENQTFFLYGRAPAGSTRADIRPNFNNIETGESLNIDDSGVNTQIHRTSTVYNGRLLTGNISTVFYSGTSVSGNVLIEFEIETALGSLTVRRTSSTNIPWLITYPDTRAKKVNIYYRDGDEWKQAFTSTLRRYGFNNFVYCWYYNPYLPSINTNPRLNFNTPIKTYVTLTTSPATDPVVTLRDINSTISDPNRVQASEVENPLVMPYKNSYQVGNSSILGFAANGEPVSEGQFGQYPVYVFTGEGMYMMDVGVDPFISSVRQINGEVCNSPGTIKNITDGVLFTTDKGLMMINGLKVTNLTPAFEHEAHNDYAVRNNALYQKAIGLAALGQPDRFVSTAPFPDYLKGSNIGYDYPNREIWVNNPEYPYSYVFSTRSGYWSKRDETFTTIVDDYPRYYAQQGNRCKNLSAKEDTANINIFLLSNPVAVRRDEFKQFRRMVARGEFTVERMGVYLFGSIDGFAWAYIGGKEIGEAYVPKFEQVKTVGAFQDAFIGADNRMYFVGASGTQNIYRLDDDGEIKLYINTGQSTVYPFYGHDSSGRLYVMSNTIVSLNPDGSHTTAWPGDTVVINAVTQTIDGRVLFMLGANAYGPGGLLIQSDLSSAQLGLPASEPYLSLNFQSSFSWNGRVYLNSSLSSQLWYIDTGQLPLPTGFNHSASGGREGRDGKFYLDVDVFGYDKGKIYRITGNNAFEEIDLGFPADYLLRNISTLSSIDGKIIYRLFHGDTYAQSLYSIYLIDSSGNLVHLIDKDFSGSAKGQDGKIYLYGSDGIYCLGDDDVLTDTGAPEGFYSAFFFDGKLYFVSAGATYRLNDNGSISEFGEELNGVIKKAGDRMYFITDEGIKYLDGDGVIKYTNITSSELNFDDVSEVNGITYFMARGYGVWYLDAYDGQIKQTNLTSGIFRFFGIGPDGNAYFALPGTSTSSAYPPVQGIFRLAAPTAGTKARDAIWLGSHRSMKYAAVLIEGIVSHEWNLTHISETLESVMNKKLR